MLLISRYGASHSQALGFARKGAVTGAITGGVGHGLENSTSMNDYQKILTESGVSGVNSEISGGKFEDGFKVGLVSASAKYMYTSIVKYDLDMEPGGDAINKEPHTIPFKDANNIGIAGTVDPNSLAGEGGKVSRALNQIRGVNAVSGVHDVMQIGFDTITNSSDGLLRSVMNVPAMIPAVAITYAADFQTSNHYILYRNVRR